MLAMNVHGRCPIVFTVNFEHAPIIWGVNSIESLGSGKIPVQKH